MEGGDPRLGKNMSAKGSFFPGGGGDIGGDLDLLISERRGRPGEPNDARESCLTGSGLAAAALRPLLGGGDD